MPQILDGPPQGVKRPVALSPDERLVTKYIGRFELEFTRKTALQLLKTAQLQMRGSSFAESAVIGQVNLFWCA